MMNVVMIKKIFMNIRKWEVNDKVFMNIRKYGLHYVIERIHVVSCVESIDSIISHTNTSNSTIINEEGMYVVYYPTFELEKYYRI
jgi:hypothetical protein